ncbi:MULTISPECIES: hypothetical protein [Gordonia]|uniref:hypothetical protein n=1 Tax=Gordonia TaxID=2053 RepID=UPI00257A7058|nr:MULTISPECIES: hypothetical protein [Gordonia]
MSRRARHVAMPRQVWLAVHVVATVAIPWALAVFYWTSGDRRTIEGSGRVAADFHTAAALAAGALLTSTVLLRIRGRTATATVPFAILWMLALAYSVNGIRAFRGKEFADYCGNVELCIPDFDLFAGAVPMAVAVSLSAVGSVVIDRKRCSARRDAGGARPRADHPRTD